MKRSNLKRLIAIALLILTIAVGGALADGAAVGQSLLAPVINGAGSCTTVVNSNQSLQAAVNAAQSGDVICARSGVYNEQIMLDYRQSNIIVQAYPGDKPILDGQGTLPTGNYQGLVQISANGSTVEGFEVRNSAARGIVVTQNPQATNAIRDVVVRNNIVHDSWDMGIVINGSDEQHAQNILVENNTVYDNLHVNTVNHIGGSGLLFVDTANSTARGNIVYHNLGEGLVGGRWTTNLIFEDNVTYDNKHANIYLSGSMSPLVRRNLVFCTDDRDYWRGAKAKPAPGITLRDEDFPNQTVKPPPSRGQKILNNIVVGCGVNFWVATQITGGGLNDAIVANNSFVNARGDTGSSANNVLFEGDITLENTKFANNLILQSDPSAASAHLILALGSPDMSTFTLLNNLYSVPPSKHWPKTESGRVNGDPKLVNPIMPVKGSVPDANNYRLQANSPAIDAGTNVSLVTEDFFKQTRSGTLDIGADEFGSAPPSTTGRIIVVKSTIPDGSTQVFNFTASYAPGGFQLVDNGTHDSGQIAAGTYSVTMTPVENWQTSSLCSDGSQPGNINLAANETVTCTFSSEFDAPPVTRITVIKQVIPSNDPTSFQFSSNFAGQFSLAHNGQKSTDLSPGNYSVSETIPEGWVQDSATCTGGQLPEAITLSEGQTVTCTFVNRKVTTGGGDLNAIVYVTTSVSGQVGGVEFNRGDILAYDGSTGTWSMFFDGSDVGMTRPIADFVILENGTPNPPILMTIGGKANLSGPGGSFSAMSQDVIRFTPTSLGADTAGSWELYLDGSDVTLAAASEKIDALGVRGNTLLISTVGKASVGVSGNWIAAQDEDLLAFTPTATGQNTSGTWAREFDGSDVEGFSKEDLTSLWYDSNASAYYVTTVDDFLVTGLSGTNNSVLIIPVTGQPSIFWDAGAAGFTYPIDGMHLVLLP